MEFLDGKITISRVALNSGVHRLPAASVTRIIEIKAHRHVTPPSLLRWCPPTSDGAPLLRCCRELCTLAYSFSYAI
jgi:hypothetical protein